MFSLQNQKPSLWNWRGYVALCHVRHAARSSGARPQNRWLKPLALTIFEIKWSSDGQFGNLMEQKIQFITDISVEEKRLNKDPSDPKTSNNTASNRSRNHTKMDADEVICAASSRELRPPKISVSTAAAPRVFFFFFLNSSHHNYLIDSNRFLCPFDFVLHFFVHHFGFRSFIFFILLLYSCFHFEKKW